MSIEKTKIQNIIIMYFQFCSSTADGSATDARTDNRADQREKDFQHIDLEAH